ncbi:50S ribosomal protein L13 [Blattabacterium cuenoti]|uniref:50S ribosomal protein L13 n=1 Tax=Blattabacterium cuenoti TaxID=1653831 RepID=UPI00163CB34E|nr:50S ribosomal protein L13 [Blattabacterium cuenoti]
MDSLSFKTISVKKKFIKKSWVLIDASDQILGRLSSKIACIIMGKHKSYFSPHIDCGDYVIVINSNKIKFSGNKWNNKEYVSYTGYPGGKKIIFAKDLFNKDSRILIYKSVKRMLPKNRLSRKIFKKNLYVYHNEKHNHNAQNPTKINLLDY